VDGRKWAADFRYVFPGEPVWDKAFKEAARRAAAAERPRK